MACLHARNTGAGGVHGEAGLAGDTAGDGVNAIHRTGCTGYDEEAALDAEVEVAAFGFEEGREAIVLHQDDITGGRGEDGGGDFFFAGRD